ncbi:hypothetical protein ES703_00114 [subsurface metagenome]
MLAAPQEGRTNKKEELMKGIIVAVILATAVLATPFISTTQTITQEIVAPAPAPSAPPTYYTATNLFGTEKRFRIDRDGEILKTIEATTEDGMLTMTIPEGTIALGEDGKRLKNLQVAVNESPPEPPEDAHIIGLAYDFDPVGATFDPPLTLEYTYDTEALPEGVAWLVLAYYDEETGEWVELPCTVDPVTHTITASVAHFTTFAIIGTVPPVPPPPPVSEEEPEVVEPVEEPTPPEEEEPEVIEPEEEEPEVVEPEEEEEVIPYVPPEEPGTPWALIGGVVGGLAAAGGIGYWLWRRRRKKVNYGS